MAVGTDVILDPNDLETSFAPGRNFANKLWNVGRFVFANLGENGTGDPTGRPYSSDPWRGTTPTRSGSEELGLADRWIIARCDRMVRAATANYEKYRLNEAASDIYHFLWSDLADWYLEQIKPRLYGTEPGGDVARAVVARTFEVALQLLHPIMPFISETLWQRFPARPQGASIMRAAWPKPDRRAVDAEAETGFGFVQEVVTAIRTLRGEYGVEPGKQVRVKLSNLGPGQNPCRAELGTIKRLAKASEVEFAEAGGEIGAYETISNGGTVFVALGDAIDVRRECDRLGKEEQRLQRLLEAQWAKLGNEQFVSRAPEQIVEKEKQKAHDMDQQLHAVSHKREILGCS